MSSLRFLPVVLPLMVTCGRAADPVGTPEAPHDGAPAEVAAPEAPHDGSPAEVAAAPEALCDGSSRLRVRIALEGGGPDVDGSYVRINHGFQALVIDGHCSYWMNAGWELNRPLSRDRGWRTGTLDPASATALQGALPLADLTKLADCSSSQVLDAPARTVRTASTKAECGGSGSRFDAAWAVVTATAEQLWPRSTPMDGAIRVAARDVGVVPGSHAPYPWPLGKLQPFLLSLAPGGVSDANTLVTDVASARQLRALREQYLSERSMAGGGFSNWDGPLVTDGTTTAFVFMRDALPYEDEGGRFPF